MKNFTEFVEERSSANLIILQGKNLPTFVLLTTIAVSICVQKLTRKKPGLLKSTQYAKNPFKQIPQELIYAPFAKSMSLVKIFGTAALNVPRSRIFKYAEEQVKIYGDIVRAHVFNYNVLVLNSAPLLESVLKSGNLDHLQRPSLLKYVMKRALKTGFFVADGKLWQSHRRIAARSLKSSALETQMDSMCWHSKLCVKNLEELFRRNKPQPIKPLLSLLFSGFAFESTTGYRDDKNETFETIQEWIDIMLEGFGKRLANPLLLFFWKLSPFSIKYNRAVDNLSAFINKLIDEHKLKRELNTASLPRNIIDELLEENLDRQQIFEDILSIIVAAADTSVYTSQYFCMMMSTHPDIQRKCQKEVDELFAANPGPLNSGTVSLEVARNELKYLERCILETLRLLPVVFAVGRELSAPLYLQHEGNTYRISAGTPVVFAPYLLHRKEEYYPEPETFQPDRFLPEEIKKRHPYAYLPFSAGPRNCIGSKIAMVQLKISCAYLLRNFSMKTVDSMDEIPLMPHIVLKPERDYRFHFERRNV